MTIQLALTSHLPHVLAAALAGVVPPELFPVAGGAYRDGTRVAGSEGMLWSGIFLDNRDALLDALSSFDGEKVRDFREALETGDHEPARHTGGLRARETSPVLPPGSARPGHASQILSGSARYSHRPGMSKQCSIIARFGKSGLQIA